MTPLTASFANAAPATVRNDSRDAARTALGKAWLNRVVMLWIFSGGFVLVEPSPYELMFLLVLGMAMIVGMEFTRRTGPVLALLLAFIPFAYLSAFQSHNLPIEKGILFVTVTVFLWVTSFFAANFVADAPFQRLQLIMRSYLAAALVITVIGVLAYLRIMPGYENFLKFERVRATFEDPNVFGPFLILPAMFALQQALLWRRRRALFGALAYFVLFLGVFASFSRGAWGHLALSSLLVFILAFTLEARIQDKVRMIILALAGIMVLIAALGVLLSIPAVADLFLVRANLLQNYDSGSTGRFGRLAYALNLALTNPLGLGPLEFGTMRITEQPHNTFVTAFLSYGWGGALAYIAFVGMTVWTGLKSLVKRSPNRLLMIPLIATFVPLVLESGIIDTDHWRHFFLIAGLIWGVAAGYKRLSLAQMNGHGPAVY